MMDEVLMLDGLGAEVTADLALTAPSATQMRLLNSPDAVHRFVSNHGLPRHLASLSAGELAEYAITNPSQVQASLLCSAEAVRAYLALSRAESAPKRKVQENDAGHPVSALLERCGAGEPPRFTFRGAFPNFLCDCIFSGKRVTGVGPSKRAAKFEAAALMLSMLH